MNNETKHVIARLAGKVITCPDCGKPLYTVRIEYSVYQTLNIDYKEKSLFSLHGKAVFDGQMSPPEEPRYRCPHCDSLNVDELIRGAGMPGKEATVEC